MASNRSTNELLRGSSDLVVLSVLAEEPLYGYGIIKKVAAQSDGAIRLTPGVLYPLLHELEKQGLLLSAWETVQSERREDDGGSGRKRKWYRLSAKGRRRLDKRAAAHRSFMNIIESFLPEPNREGTL